MPQKRNKKILIYIFLFLIIGTFNNKYLNNISFPKIDKILINGIDDTKNLSLVEKLNFLRFKNLFFISKDEIVQILDQYNYIHKYQSLFSYINLEKGKFPQNHLVLRSKQKSEFRRIAKKHFNSTHLILSINNSEFPINRINALRNKMIKRKVRRKSFLDTNFLNLIQSLYDKNELIISIIKNDSCIKAISFVLKKDNNFLFWVDMFDHSKMINIFNYIKFISVKSSIKDVNVNFGRGDYLYKLNNFKPKIESLLHINIFFGNLDLLYFKARTKILSFVRKTYKIIFK